ncbi:MAG: hypothetical protein Q9170_007740 [Blastenia crenularia]
MLQRLLHKGTDKSRHYLDLLDTARCQGRWSEVPELVRKNGKHSPQRKCLHLTAQAEYQLATASTGLSQIIPRLRSLSQEATADPEDVFQARVCLGWLHWTLNEAELALEAIPKNPSQAYNELDQGGARTSGWSSVCAVKGACLRGDLQEKSGNIDEALATYESILFHIERTLATANSSPEYCSWTEKLLAQYCLLSNRILRATIDEKGQETRTLTAALSPFRAWSSLWPSICKTGSAGGTNQPAKSGIVSRRRIWQIYYDTLSAILQKGLSYPGVAQGSSTSANEMTTDNIKSLENPKLLQSIELRRVASIYEEILLREVSFPKASEANVEVESWVDQIMANWRVISNPSWLNEDLGKGGKEAITRSISAILYRAATRTFHSTRVLRHLFTIHTALAEFNLAAKAFDTYVELVSRGKARVEKSGESEIGLDDDGTVLRTTAAGVQMLCFYGRRKEFERAQEIALILEKWLEKIESPLGPIASADDNPADLQNEQNHQGRPVSREAFAVAYHSLGVCRAHWARLTYETSSRPQLHEKAMTSFRKALTYVPAGTESAGYHYALAAILAETRDIDTAIDSAKQAIAACTRNGEEPIQLVDFAELQDDHMKRISFKSWHLLALLLSARQEFPTADVSFEAADELYSDLLETVEPQKAIERLALSEREYILELRMSRLVLSEILDGPEEAVNACGDLLELYKQFFVRGETSHAQPPAVAESSPNGTSSTAQTANGTAKSRRSLLGRSKEAVGGLPRIGNHSNHGDSRGKAQQETPRDVDVPSTPDEPAVERKYQPPLHLARQESRKLHKRHSRKSMASDRHRRGSSPTKSSLADGSQDSTQALPLRIASLKRSSLDTSPGGPTVGHRRGDLAATGTAVTNTGPSDQKPSSSGIPPTTSHSTHHKNQNQAPVFPKHPLSGSLKASPISSHLMPPLPDPIYSSMHLNRHALTLLARIWLLISQLYRDAGMLVDAQGALSEAFRQAQSIEAAVAAIESNAQALASPGWGSLKSVSEIWADVFAEQGALHLQLGNTDAASEAYETALGWFADHNAATVGLSTILLDYYDYKQSVDKSEALPTQLPKSKPILARLPTSGNPGSQSDQQGTPSSDESATLLSRLAARDRAYGLLSMLTKSGRGWDDSEAWSALARAYEQSGEIEKAKEALWWVVELEDSRPLRDWSCVGGF